MAYCASLLVDCAPPARTGGDGVAPKRVGEGVVTPVGERLYVIAAFALNDLYLPDSSEYLPFCLCDIFVFPVALAKSVSFDAVSADRPTFDDF